MVDVNKMIDDLVSREGGYVNDPSDAGGETNFGITLKVARANGYAGAMKDMTHSQAALIYKQVYWTKPGFDQVWAIFPQLGEKLFDFGVNCGQSVSATALQRCLTALNDRGKDYPDLKPDGNIGPTTIKALQSFIARRGGDMGRRTLLFMVAAIQSVRYLEIAEHNPEQEKFLNGWEGQRALYDAVM